MGVKSQLLGASAQLTLFLGNKHGEALQQVVLALPPNPAFAYDMGPVPQQLEPKKQVRLCSGCGCERQLVLLDDTVPAALRVGLAHNPAG